jgi:hypothetical protein
LVHCACPLLVYVLAIDGHFNTSKVNLQVDCR